MSTESANNGRASLCKFTDRFPEDFIFELSETEIETVESQNLIPHKKYLGGAKPFAFRTDMSVMPGRKTTSTNTKISNKDWL